MHRVINSTVGEAGWQGIDRKSETKKKFSGLRRINFARGRGRGGGDCRGVCAERMSVKSKSPGGYHEDTKR